MAWFTRSRRTPTAGDSNETDPWARYVARLRAHGIPEPGSARNAARRPATKADERALYDVAPSFVDLLPWVEYLPASQSMLLDDGVSVAAFLELTPLGTEGREPSWLSQTRDVLENVLQDAFDESESCPWVAQFYVQDEPASDVYLDELRRYVHPRARGSAFTEFYLATCAHHMRAIEKPGGLFKDETVSQLRWRGHTRRVRLVIYQRTASSTTGGVPSPEDALTTVCDRLTGGLANAGVRVRRLGAADIHAWLLRWFHPHPTLLGPTPEDRERFYALARYPEPNDGEPDEIELASGRDFSQRLFFGQPRSDVEEGLWYFDHRPHRAISIDRLRSPPTIGHLTGETHRGGDAINAVMDQMPEDTVLCVTLVITPQDVLEAHLAHLARKSVGDTLASEQTRQDVKHARGLIGSAHKLYRGSLTCYVSGCDRAELESRSLQLCTVLLNAGMQPVREGDEVAPLNTYLRWLPCVFDPAKDQRQWYTQLLFAQHVTNLAPWWGRTRGTGHVGLTFFNRSGETVSIDPLNRLDRQMNAHLFIFGPTGSGKSATLSTILHQVTAIYRPRLFIVEVGNSFGLFGEFAARLGLTVHRVRLAPGSGVSLAPFADAHRLVDQVHATDADALDDDHSGDEKRDILGELEIQARLLITGGEEREEARMTRADRSLIRQCILDAARSCASESRQVLTSDVRDALRARGTDPTLPESRRLRLSEMADAMDIFCQGTDGETFDRPGTPWPEADVTIVDLATYAREGYSAHLSLAYLSLITVVHNIAERDQYLGRPIISVTDEGHIITKNQLLAPTVVKITKMWRKFGAWYWLATQNLDDLPVGAQPMLSMIEWWICLSMPPDEVEKIAKFRELSPAQKRMLLSARKESGKYVEGVILCRNGEFLFRVVPPSVCLALAQTEQHEKAERHELMNACSIDELGAALKVAQRIDQARGIPSLPLLDAFIHDVGSSLSHA
jgi:conjugative transfer ATPase